MSRCIHCHDKDALISQQRETITRLTRDLAAYNAIGKSISGHSGSDKPQPKETMHTRILRDPGTAAGGQPDPVKVMQEAEIEIPALRTQVTTLTNSLDAANVQIAADQSAAGQAAAAALAPVNAEAVNLNNLLGNPVPASVAAAAATAPTPATPAPVASAASTDTPAPADAPAPAPASS